MTPGKETNQGLFDKEVHQVKLNRGFQWLKKSKKKRGKKKKKETQVRDKRRKRQPHFFQ